jgi:surfactin family lipopeptide synthetase A
MIEGHGREAINGHYFDSEVGWFTSLYPVVIEARNSFPETLTQIAKDLSETPQGGVGYGVLKYLAGLDPLPQGAKADLVFNYLGGLDDSGPAGQLEVVQLGSAHDIPAGFSHPGAFSFGAYIQGGVLIAELSQHVPIGVNLEAWASGFKRLLTELGD